jgi:glycerophosphoryl diester phosphodiesterase
VRRPLVYGHRGAPAELPENTLASFARAVERGVDGLETDVHETRDGVVVLAHDESLLRTAGVPMCIADLPYRELAKIPLLPVAGAPKEDQAPTFVPTLDEALDRFPSMFFNIEVKPRSTDLARRVARHLTARGDAHRVRLAGAEHRVLRVITPDIWAGKRSSSAFEVAKLYFAPRRLIKSGFLPGDALQVPVAQRIGPFTARFDQEPFLARAAAAGLDVHYWTINDPQEAIRLAGLGAVVIMTDDPRAIVAALRVTS